MSIKYDSNGFPIFVPDTEEERAAPESPGFWESYGKPTLSAIGDIASLPMKGGGLLAGLAMDSLGGEPSVRLEGNTGLWDDITGRSTTAPTLPALAVQGAKLGAISLAPSLEDTIGERVDVRRSSGLAEQSPEEVRSWQASHPVAAYTKAVAEPIAELGFGIALDPTLAAMRVLGMASKAPALLKAAEAASKAGRTLEAAESAAKAAAALRASRTMRAIVSGESELGRFAAANPSLAQGAERALGAAYVPSMAIGAIEGAKETARQYKESGMSPDVVRSGLEATSSGVFAGLGMKHALTPQAIGPRTTGLSPERLDTALRGADLAQDVVRARAAAEVAPQVENATIAAAPAPVAEAPRNLAYRVRTVGEQGVPVFPDSHAQLTRDINEPKAYAAKREEISGAPQEIVTVDLDKAGPYEETSGPGGAPWIRLKQPAAEDAIASKWAPTAEDLKFSSDPATTAERLNVPNVPTELLVEATGLPPDRVEKGKEDVRRDASREFSVEGQAVRRAMALDSGLPAADVITSGEPRVGADALGGQEGALGQDQGLLLARTAPGARDGSQVPVGNEPAPVIAPTVAPMVGVLAPPPTGVVGAPVGEAPAAPARPVLGVTPEHIIAQTRREAYQALRSKYGDAPPDVKTMVDQHGVKIEWANDIRKRWGTPAWEGEAITAPLRTETTPAQQSPEHAAVVKDLAYQLTQNPPMGFEATAREEGGRHYVDLVKDGMHARVDVASGTVEAATGGPALGEMRVNPSIPNEAVLTIAKTAATPNTINHEMAEWMARLLPEAEQVQLARQYGMRGWEDRFARAYEKWEPGVKNSIFSKIYDLARPLADSILSERQKSEAIMRLMSEGKLVQRMGGAAFTNPQARVEIARELEAQPEPTKKQVAMALARDLGVEDIVRHEAGADAFLFDATSLLRGSVRDVTRINPIGTAFLRDVVDPKTNYGTYAPALEKAKSMFGDDLQRKYEEWVNTRQLPSVGAAFERIRGDVKTRRTIGVGIEHAVRADLESIVPDLKQTLGIAGVGEQVGAGAFANVFDLGPDSGGVRRVARVSALPGDNARPRMVSEFIAPEIGRQFTADKREVTIQPYTYSKEEVGKNQQQFDRDVERITKGLETQGFKDLDIHDSNVRYLDKEGTKPVVVDLGSVQPKDSKVPAAEWIANKTDPGEMILHELAAFGSEPGNGAYIPHVREALSDQMTRAEFDSALRDLEKSGRVALSEHSVPGLVNPQERAEFLDSKYMVATPKERYPQTPDLAGEESAIARALAQENPQSISQGALVYIPKLRAALAEALPGKEFDRALLRLFRRGDVELRSHAVPADMKPADKAQSISDGHGSYYMAVGVRDTAFRKYQDLATRRTSEMVGAELDKAVSAAREAILESQIRPSPEAAARVDEANARMGRLQDEYDSLGGGDWIANKVDEYVDQGDYNPAPGPGVGRTSAALDTPSIRAKFGTFAERMRFMFADKLYYLKKAEAAMYEMHGKGAVVPKSESAASALEVMPSRAMDRIGKVVDVARDETNALMAKNNVSIEDVGAVLVAEHAPVRNRVGAEQGVKVESAMGVSDADAAKVKADMIADGTWERAMPAANRFRKLMQDQVDLMEEYHLAPPERIAALRSPEWRDTYAPAKHEDPLNPWEPSSGGGGVRNPLKRFAGRATPPDNPLGFGYAQAAETIAKGEQNLGWNKFAEFITQNPDENWKVLDAPKMHGSKVEIGGKLQVASVPDKGWMDKHTIAFRDAAGAEKFIQIDDPRVMESLKRSGPDTTGEVLGYISKGMRFYSGLLTRWNPEFLLPNLQRDLQMALGSIGVEKGARVVKQVAKGVIPAMRAAWKVLRNPEASGGWEDSYKEYSAAGGPMRVLELKNGPQYLKEAGKELERMTKPNQFKEVFRKSVKVLDDLNGAVETGVRLSYFRALREAGMSVEAAIHASKDLTVNFDRRGALGPAMNALYLFFNASVQGGMRTAQVLNSPRGRKAALAMMVGGYALDQAQAASGEDSNGDGISDWDSIPEYVKERNLIIGNATIPMPYGFNTIVNAGRLASAVQRGQMSPAKAASNGALSFFSTFNPFGGAEDFTQMVTPSFLEPFVQSATNKNFAGNAIVPDQPKWGAKKPDSERFWRTTSPAARWLAQTGNSLTGGDKLSAGFVDISPNTIEHWSNFALGGWSRILSGSQAVVESVAKGEPIPISKIPILRRQYYEEHPADVGRMWRATQEEMEQLKARAEMYQKDRQFDRLRKIPRPLLGMSDYLARVEREAQDIQKAARSGAISEKVAQERVHQLQIRSLLNVTKARQRAESMGFNGGYAASPGSGI